MLWPCDLSSPAGSGKAISCTLSSVLLIVTESSFQTFPRREQKRDVHRDRFLLFTFQISLRKANTHAPVTAPVTPRAGITVSGNTRRGGSEAGRVPLPGPGRAGRVRRAGGPCVASADPASGSALARRPRVRPKPRGLHIYGRGQERLGQGLAGIIEKGGRKVLGD